MDQKLKSNKEYTFDDFKNMKCSECAKIEGGKEYLYSCRCRMCQHFRRGCSYIH